MFSVIKDVRPCTLCCGEQIDDKIFNIQCRKVTVENWYESLNTKMLGKVN